ncbi:unnamed protein product [Ilex paraguariensis]|uniref:Uncharacterized protein n=1 Tax=Ilex paraguariensis TaxID=185542 RepID=A0ABC8R1J7_9AQUA
MDSDERLTALKKAYADIILNTAKEAAARIMVSEKRALRFQRDLYAAKEEALQMLLRLKQMMDSKICEAEIKSSNQQKTIEELEAQLHEAEDIVRDLREELRKVQAELERVSNNKVQPLDELDMATPEETSEINRLYTSQTLIFPHPQSQHEYIAASDMRNLYLNPGNEGNKCSSSIVHTGNSYMGNPDIPSIILRRKKPELYRNGCTQRIRACKRKALSKALSYSGLSVREDEKGERICTTPTIRACKRKPLNKALSLSELINDVKHKSSAREDEKDERICTTPTHEADHMCTENKGVHANSRLGSWYKVQAVTTVCRKRKRVTRKRKYRTLSCRFLPEQSMKMAQAPAIPCLGSIPVNNNAPSTENSYEMAPRLTSDNTGMSIQLGCAETNGSDAEFVKACDFQSTMVNDDILVDKLLTMRQQIGSTESSGAPIGRMNIEEVDVPLADSEGSKAPDTTHGVPTQPVPDRIIKYTFQRKRKRVSLTSIEGNNSLETSTFEGKPEEKQTGSVEPQKSSLITESSRDSRRLAQVARQLISLSEKKWWQ